MDIEKVAAETPKKLLQIKLILKIMDQVKKKLKI